MTGSGTNGQVALWSSSSSINGNSGLTYGSSLLSVTGDITISGSISGSVGLRTMVWHTPTLTTTTTGTWMLLPFNFNVRDDSNSHSITSTSRLYAKTAGWYTIALHAKFAFNATGIRVGGIKLNSFGSFNGGQWLAFDAMNAIPAASWDSPVAPMAICYLNVGDYVEAFVFQSSGGNLDVRTNAYDSPIFTMVRIP